MDHGDLQQKGVLNPDCQKNMSNSLQTATNNDRFENRSMMSCSKPLKEAKPVVRRLVPVWNGFGQRQSGNCREQTLYIQSIFL